MVFVKNVPAARLAGWVLVMASFPSAVVAQTCPSNVPHLQGVWRTLPYLAPINPISATLLNTGRILIVAGSENDANNNSPGAESYRNAVWDPAGTTQSSITVQNITYDVFCSGTAALPDGRSLVIGGTSDYSFKGDNRASIFDPATGRFLQSQSMVNGRWYGTATALGDGRIMAFSGLNLAGGTNNTVEIYDLRNAGAGWTAPVGAPFSSPPLYPHMFLLPNGKVFFTGQGSGRMGNAWVFDPAGGTWTQSVATTMDRSYGSAVILPLLPPSYTPKVMNFGGGNPATATTEIIDLSFSTPSWTPGPSMSSGRIEMNAVILPNGKVLAEGGSVNNESPSPAGKQADLYDPVTNSITSAGTASYSRLYHSTALLLPDATVMSMGSNPGPRGNYEPAIEIYTPPYLFDGNDHLITNRPSITGISSQVLGYNSPFTVTYTSSSPISSAVLIRLGSSTHAFDMEQRLVGLCGASPQAACTGSGTLNLTTPPNGTIAPPGYYMLFVLDGGGVPSVAQMIQISPYTTPPPRGSISSPADVTITAGGSVSFATTTTAAKYSWIFPGGSPAFSTAQAPGNVTFNTPGTYVTSLTVVDSSGNSDFSPPTRTITVLPATADFDIAVAPSSQAVIPGQSASFTVTVTPKSGFSSTVSLAVSSENGFPTGVTSGGFSPSSITGSGTSTLTMNTTTSAVPFALSLTIKGTSGTLAHTAATTLLVHLAPPASLTATPGAGQVALSWPASTSATAYHVKRSLMNGGPYEIIACPTSTTFTDTAVSNGVTYYYVVSAAYTGGPNAGGESADSVQASAALQLDTQPPSAPSNVTASSISGSQINLSWTASTDNVGVTNYLVERCQGAGCNTFTQIGTTSGTATSYSDTGLTAVTSYSYRVRAIDAAGNLSFYSNVASATTSSATTTITYVQGNYAAPPSQSTVSVTYSSAQVSGDLNVVAVAWNNSTTALSSITDTSGNVYMLAGTPAVISGTGTQSIYYAKNIRDAAAGANTVTVTFVGSVPYPDIRIAEYTGADPNNPVDVTVAATGDSATSNSGSLTTTNATDLLYAANYVATMTTGPGSGFTSRLLTNDGSIAEDQMVTSTGTYSATAPLSGSGWWIMQMIAFRTAPTTQSPTTPGNLTATAASATQINLSWTASTSTVGLANYIVQRCQGTGCFNFAQITSFPATTTTYNDAGLTVGTSYSYRVQASDTSGNLGSFSNAATTSTQTPPTSPGSLTATASSDTQINVSWTASTSTVGLAGYTVQRCQGAGCTSFTQVASLASTATTYNDIGLTTGTSYSYRVQARDTSGNLSAFSNVATATAQMPPTAPGSLTATAVNATQINLSWTASTSGTGLANYIVQRCQGAGCTNFAQIASLAATVTTYSNTGLTASTSYSYRVQARDTSGNLSAFSNIASTSTQTPPTAPGSLTSSAVNNAQINLSWTASTSSVGVASYIVQRCQGAGCSNFAQVASAPAGTTSYSDTGLNASTSYSYRVQASDNSGNLSAFSNVATATTQGPPTTPGNLTATAASSTQINLSWTASTSSVGLANYLIEQCQGAGCTTFTQIASVAGSMTSFSNTGLSAGVSYSYRVRASDTANNLSPYSNVASATTLTPPTGLRASTGNPRGSVNLTWTQSVSSGVTQNNIFRRTSSGIYSSTPTATISATTSYLDSRLTSGTTYCYVVTASTNGGESAKSTESCASAK